MSGSNKFFLGLVMCVLIGGISYISSGPGFDGVLDKILGRSGDYAGKSNVEAVLLFDVAAAKDDVLLGIGRELRSKAGELNIVVQEPVVTHGKLECVFEKAQHRDAYEQFVKAEISGRVSLDAVEMVEDTLVFSFSFTPGYAAQVTGGIRQGVEEVLRKRTASLGVEASTVKESADRFVVVANDIENGERVASLLARRADLDFRLAEDAGENGGNPPAGMSFSMFVYPDKDGKDYELPLFLHAGSLVTGKDIQGVEIGELHDEQPVLAMDMTEASAKKIAQVTRDNVGKRIAILLDGVVYAAPQIQSEISGQRILLARNFTQEEAYDLGVAIKSGAYPAPVELIRVRTWE